MMNANWRVISYLGSLKFDAVSNVLLFVASILELSGRVMFTTGCFLLLVESENVVDALLNCLALHFVIEFEDLLTQLSPRLTQSSTVALRRLCAANKHSDIALFFSVPDRKWAPYAFHRLCCWGRCVCLALRSALVGLWVLLVVLFVQSLPSCYSILMTPDAYAHQHWIPHNDMRLFRPFYETHGSSLLMALAQVADGCAYTSNPNHAEYNAGAYSYGAYWICNGYYVMPPAPPPPPPPPPPSPQAPLSRGHRRRVLGFSAATATVAPAATGATCVSAVFVRLYRAAAGACDTQEPVRGTQSHRCLGGGVQQLVP